MLAGVALGGAPGPIGTMLTICAGALAGGLWIAVAGALKHLRGVNETISTLLLNYIAIALLNHLVSGPIRDFSQTLKAQSWSIPDAFMIGNIPGWSVHWGLVIGLVACLRCIFCCATPRSASRWTSWAATGAQRRWRGCRSAG